MNYNDYQEIKKADGLQESLLVKYYLNEAAKCQKYAKGLLARKAPKEAIERQMYKKDEFIWLAIFTAQDEKEQGWRYVEDGPKVLPVLKQQLEDIREAEFLRKKVANGS